MSKIRFGIEYFDKYVRAWLIFAFWILLCRDGVEPAPWVLAVLIAGFMTLFAVGGRRALDKGLRIPCLILWHALPLFLSIMAVLWVADLLLP